MPINFKNIQTTGNRPYDATRVARRYDDGGELTTPSWNGLTMREKSDVMAAAVRNGITSLKEIRQRWNEFAEEGHLYKDGGKTNQRNQRAGYAVDYFMNKGLSREAAAGLVGNLMRESGMNPNALNSDRHGGAHGIAQWRGARWANLQKMYGKNPTLDNQLDYVWHELNTTHKKGLQKIMASKTVDDAARNAFGYYEFSAGPEAAIAAMNGNGRSKGYNQPNGTMAMNTGINYAHAIYGNAPKGGVKSVYQKSRFALPSDKSQDIDFFGTLDNAQMPENPVLASIDSNSIPPNPTDYGTPVDYTKFLKPVAKEDSNVLLPEKRDSGIGLMGILGMMGADDAVNPYDEAFAQQEPVGQKDAMFVVPVSNDTLLDDSWFAQGGALYNTNLFAGGGVADVPPESTPENDPDYYLKQALANGSLMTKSVANPSRGETVVHPDDIVLPSAPLGGELTEDDRTVLEEYGNELPAQDDMDSYIGDMLNNYNDATSTGNTTNEGLGRVAQQGIEERAAFNAAYPYRAMLGEVLTGAPGIAISAPLIGSVLPAASDALMATRAGQAINTGLNTLNAATASSTIYPWLDNGVTSFFGAQGINDMVHGNANAGTAFELMPLVQLAKPVYNVARTTATEFPDLVSRAEDWALENAAKNGFNRIWENPFLNKSYIRTKGSFSNNGEAPFSIEIPFDEKQAAAQRMIDFINSEDYGRRLENAGLERHWDFMKQLTKDRLSDGHFPAVTRDIVDKTNLDAEGMTNINPKSSDYGITLQSGLPYKTFLEDLDHEVGHWSTLNVGTSDIVNRIRGSLYNYSYNPKLGDIMRYNEKIAPTRTWEEYRKNALPSKMPTDALNTIKSIFDDIATPQEKRQRAYAMLEKAKREGISTDEFVDKYSQNGYITNSAPVQLQQLGMVFTVENLKKYLKNFLSISAAITTANKLKNEK